jgi:hypothetical protein
MGKSQAFNSISSLLLYRCWLLLAVAIVCFLIWWRYGFLFFKPVIRGWECMFTDFNCSVVLLYFIAWNPEVMNHFISYICYSKLMNF